MNKKTFITFLAALCLTITSALPVTASTVNEADTWKSGTGSRPSTGQAIIKSDSSGEINKVIGDDSAHDSVDGRAFTEGVGGAQVNVWAKVVELDLQFTIYAVEIEWGDMLTAFRTGEAKWDYESHDYTGELPGSSGWMVDNSTLTTDGIPTDYYLEQGNNKITVTNHSNGAINAAFSYNHISATVFNSDSGVNNVVGGFYATEATAKAGALVLTDPTNNASYNTLPNSKIALPTAIGRAKGNTDLEGEVYFAYSGTPDRGKSASLESFNNTGMITITITPNSDTILNTPGV